MANHEYRLTENTDPSLLPDTEEETPLEDSEIEVDEDDDEEEDEEEELEDEDEEDEEEEELDIDDEEDDDIITGADENEEPDVI